MSHGSVVIPLALVLPPTTSHSASASTVRVPCLVLVSAAVAVHAVGDVGDPLFAMLGSELRERVFVATGAGVRLETASWRVAVGAVRGVIVVEPEVPVVIERRLRPCTRRVTGPAVIRGRESCMELIVRPLGTVTLRTRGTSWSPTRVVERGRRPVFGHVACATLPIDRIVDEAGRALLPMARVTCLSKFRRKAGVSEPSCSTAAEAPGVLGMARCTVGRADSAVQFGDAHPGHRSWFVRGTDRSDRLGRVAACAPVAANPRERDVARETVVAERGVPCEQRARLEHCTGCEQ